MPEIILNDNQLAARDIVISNIPLCAVTGPGGTGKTTIVKSIMAISPRFTLLAPTGKAASRLAAASGYPAQTVHAFLGYNGVEFRRDYIESPLIIDEASMIDESLWWQILRRNPPKVVLLGDSSQLEPVGAGSPFADFVQNFPERVVHLTKNYRSGEAIHETCMKIRNGDPLIIEDIVSENERVVFRKTTTANTAERLFMQDYLVEHFDPKQDALLMCRNGNKEPAEDRDYATVNSMNGKLREHYNPTATKRLSPGDRVMCMGNFPEYDLYNGDVGDYLIADCEEYVVDEEGRIVQDLVTGQPKTQQRRGFAVKLDRWGKPMILPGKILRRLQHAWAFTVHKSQGSQFRHVFILLSGPDRHMLKRRLIYTAVSRAQKGCFIIGNPDLVADGIGSEINRMTVGDFFYQEDEQARFARWQQ